MNERSHKAERLIWLGMGLTGAVLLLAFLLGLLKMRNAIGQPLPVLGQVADFTLTNQNGAPVTLADLKGRVWVADIIFTRCAGPCPRMTRRMKELQQALPPGASTRLVSLTTDPDYDTPAVLQAYAKRFEADPQRWMFLTGTKPQIAALAIDSLKLTAVEKKPEERTNPEDLFIHSTIFVIVDKRARLRAIYDPDAEGADPARVHRLMLAAIRRLEREPAAANPAN